MKPAFRWQRQQGEQRMSDIKLFRTDGEAVTQLMGHSVALEKSLQTLIEKNLDVFLGIRFLATEHSTGKTHGGRIDTLGIDENGCPCIIEYKRSSNENVINQGLFYLDWLLDHKGEFELLVLKKYGQKIADSIEWSSPRLLCIAGDFTKYDGHAVQQINRNIELIRYLRFGKEFLLLELVNAVQATLSDNELPTVVGEKSKAANGYKTITDQLAQADQSLLDVYDAVKSTCMGFGDDVQFKTLKFYVAFKRLKNFATVELRTSVKTVLVFVKVDPDSVKLADGVYRDVRTIGHFGTGDLEITLRNLEDLELALPLLEKSYEVS
jgi:predicted transport protein